MESLLQAFRANMAAERGCSPEDIEEEELVDMLEQGIEEEEEDGPEEEEEEEAMDSQEQVIQRLLLTSCLRVPLSGYCR